jgi:hypothetical protein
MVAVAMAAAFSMACGSDGGDPPDAAAADPCATTTQAAAGAPTSTTEPCVVDGTTTTALRALAGGGGYGYELIQPIPQANGTQYQTAELDIHLVADGGSVTGTVEGPTYQRLTQPACPSDTVTPGRTTAEVEGTLTDDALELVVVEAHWQRPAVQPCHGQQPGLIGDGLPSGLIGFEDSLARRERVDDGPYRYDETVTFPNVAPYTVEYHVVVRFEEP